MNIHISSTVQRGCDGPLAFYRIPYCLIPFCSNLPSLLGVEQQKKNTKACKDLSQRCNGILFTGLLWLQR